VAAHGDFTAGVEARVGETYAGGDATLRNRSVIEGPLHVEGALTVGHDVRIDGGVLRDGPFVPGTTTSFHVPLPGAGAAEVVLAPGESAALTPGEYARIVLGPRSRLELAPGVYSTSDLHVAPGAELVTSPDLGGPSILVVTTDVFYHGAVLSTATDPSLLIAYLGAERLHLHTSFDGWVVAPQAELVLAPGADYRGAFIGASIQVLPRATITHVPLSWDFVRSARGACGLEPRVFCVRSDGSGGHVAVFGYTNALPHYGALVPLGPFNRLIGGDETAFPRQAFLPRGEDEAFEVAFEDSVTWILGGRTAAATVGGPSCP